MTYVALRGSRPRSITAACCAVALSAIAAACSTFGSDSPSSTPPPAPDAAEADGSGIDGASGDGGAACATAEELDAGEDANCGSGNVDLSTSDDHCGFCERACLPLAGTHACAGGVCAPQTLVPVAGASVGAITSSEVFYAFTNGTSQVNAAALADGSNNRILAYTESQAIRMAVDVDTLWFETYGGIYRVPSNPAGLATPDPIETGTNVFHSLFVTTDAVYWRNVLNGTVRRYTKTSGTKEDIVPPSATPTDVERLLAVDDGAIVWASSGAGPGCTSKILIRRASAPGSDVVRADNQCLRALALDATSIWFGGEQALYRMSRDGTEPPVTVARWGPAKPHLMGIVPDGARVLWLAGDDSNGVNNPDQYPTLYEAPTCGGRVRVLHPAVRLPSGAAQDAMFLYLGTADGASRIAK
jgi:hypothetical protein